LPQLSDVGDQDICALDQRYQPRHCW
jgi:hypothetical protein